MKLKQMMLIPTCYLLASCYNEESRCAVPSSGKVEVTFRVALCQPDPMEAYTRSGTSDSDTEIHNMDLLVFDSEGRFMDRLWVEPSDLVGRERGVDFSVRLDATADRRIIHLIANGRERDGVTDRLNFSDITVGMPEQTAIACLRSPPLHQVAEGSATLLTNLTPLLMWGRSELSGVSVETRVTGVQLLRATACIRLQSAITTLHPLLEGLRLLSFGIHRGAGHGFLAPSDCTGPATIPTTTHPATDNPYLDYSKAQAPLSADCGTLYVYERNCSAADHMSLILQAVTTANDTMYYKVLLIDAIGNPIPIVRNHRYTVTVVGVSGPGGSLQTVLASPPGNALKVKLRHEDTDFPSIVADGRHLMALSNNRFDLYGAGARVDLATVFCSSGVAPVVHSTLTPASAWFTPSVLALGGNKYRITGTFLPGSAAAYTGSLSLVCGTLVHNLLIHWRPLISRVADSDSYVLDLVSAEDRSWRVKIIHPTSHSWLFLHPRSATPAAFLGSATPAGGMTTELTSKYSAHAYLHIALQGSNRQAVLQMTTASNSGVVDSKRIVISQ